MKILVTWHWHTVIRMVEPFISALLIHIKRILSMLKSISEAGDVASKSYGLFNFN